MSIPWDRTIRTIREHVFGSSVPSVSQIAAGDRDPFRVLVSTMISLRTKDDVTLEASRKLLHRAPGPRELARLDTDTIAELIYPAGFYAVKAKHLKRAAEILLDRYDGEVPAGRDELLELPGVGRKTANLVLNLGFGKDAICVDTHVHRISNRLGWVRTKIPDETERDLMEVLPRSYWIEINALLIRFGQKTCTPVSPFCSRCPLEEECPRRGIPRSR
jgi:endonuclease-3